MARDTQREVELGRELSDRLVELAREHTELGEDQVDVHLDFSDAPHATIVHLAEEHAARLLVVGHKGQTGLRRLLLGSTVERVVHSAPCPVLVAREHAATGVMLVATDLSDPALSAVEYGAAQHRELGLKLILLHNIEVPGAYLSGLAPLGPVPPQPSRETLDEVTQTVQRILADQLERFGVGGETLVTAEPRTDEVILRVAEEHDVELLVIGSRGHTRLERLSLGSVAHSVVRHASCAVLSVHAS